MTCQEFASIARDYARRQWIGPRQQDEAREHLEGCAGCRLRLEAEAAIDTGLLRLRASDAQSGAGPQVEAAVMAAFAARQRTRRPLVWRKWAWAAAAIPVAAALAIAYLGSRQAPTPQEGVVAWQESLPQQRERVAQPPPAERLPVPVAAGSAPPQTESAPRVHRAPRGRSNTVERVSSFVPVRYGKPVEPGEPLQMIRIQLPQAELIRLGIPVPPDASRALIQADVLLGEDGLAKAIRFVW